ncbi:ModE molybdate transport repressor domain-containing protein [Devosia enhydra]|uniref:ModE molybdate transport repressor domain-containing protein n=1 Tax=Devosia enhydra TaxID=665118 RepID=A0A1K2HVY6_9HYPH|nr:LysR family transcriptional regulator [Devosia enhydra]SFZ83054.1 ModE molybdate transport repressor domain-containing protein [Devosia enhydra]
MRITLAQIEAFYWIARLGSFHAAARQLNLTQPSISGRIRELERELGNPLFDRTGGKARLTAAGRSILDRSETLLGLARDIEGGAQPDGLRGLLRLGVVETVAHLALAELVAALRARHPLLRIELSVDIGANLLRQLDDRQLDVAVTTDAQASPGISIRPIGEIDLAWLGPSGHPLADTVLTPRALSGETVFTQPEGSTIGRAIGDWFASAEATPGALSGCTSLSITAELVASGLGFAILTPAILRPDVAARIHRFTADPPLTPRRLSVAALSELPDRDIGFIADLVAQAFTSRAALSTSSAAGGRI